VAIAPLAEDGLQISAGLGAAGCLWQIDPALLRLDPDIAAYDANSLPEAESRLGELRAKRLRPAHGGLFPNLALAWESGTLRLAHPRGPYKTEVWSYCLVDRAAPAAVRTAKRRLSMLHYGPSGFGELNDAANLEQTTLAARSLLAAGAPLNLQAGLGQERFHEDLPGRLGNLFSEVSQRDFYRHWQDLLLAPDWGAIDLS
jgi:3-phenylpropionate/trans-cinnamate dioxygenase alpha subunit